MATLTFALLDELVRYDKRRLAAKEPCILDLSNKRLIDLAGLELIKIELGKFNPPDFRWNEIVGVHLDFNMLSNLDQLEDLGDVDKIKVISASHNNLTKMISSQNVIDFANLVELNLSYNEIRDFPNMEMFPTIEVLNFSHNKLMSNDLRKLMGVVSLQRLDISFNNIDWDRNNEGKIEYKLDGLDTLVSLKEIDVMGNPFTKKFHAEQDWVFEFARTLDQLKMMELVGDDKVLATCMPARAMYAQIRRIDNYIVTRCGVHYKSPCAMKEGKLCFEHQIFQGGLRQEIDPVEVADLAEKEKAEAKKQQDAATKLSEEKSAKETEKKAPAQPKHYHLGDLFENATAFAKTVTQNNPASVLYDLKEVVSKLEIGAKYSNKNFNSTGKKTKVAWLLQDFTPDPSSTVQTVKLILNRLNDIMVVLDVSTAKVREKLTEAQYYDMRETLATCVTLLSYQLKDDKLMEKCRKQLEDWLSDKLQKEVKLVSRLLRRVIVPQIAFLLTMEEDLPYMPFIQMALRIVKSFKLQETLYDLIPLLSSQLVERLEQGSIKFPINGFVENTSATEVLFVTSGNVRNAQALSSYGATQEILNRLLQKPAGNKHSHYTSWILGIAQNLARYDIPLELPNEQDLISLQSKRHHQQPCSMHKSSIKQGYSAGVLNVLIMKLLEGLIPMVDEYVNLNYSRVSYCVDFLKFIQALLVPHNPDGFKMLVDPKSGLLTKILAPLLNQTNVQVAYDPEVLGAVLDIVRLLLVAPRAWFPVTFDSMSLTFVDHETQVMSLLSGLARGKRRGIASLLNFIDDSSDSYNGLAVCSSDPPKGLNVPRAKIRVLGLSAEAATALGKVGAVVLEKDKVGSDAEPSGDEKGEAEKKRSKDESDKDRKMREEEERQRKKQSDLVAKRDADAFEKALPFIRCLCSVVRLLTSFSTELHLNPTNFAARRVADELYNAGRENLMLSLLQAENVDLVTVAAHSFEQIPLSHVGKMNLERLVKLCLGPSNETNLGLADNRETCARIFHLFTKLVLAKGEIGEAFRSGIITASDKGDGPAGGLKLANVTVVAAVDLLEKNETLDSTGLSDLAREKFAMSQALVDFLRASSTVPSLHTLFRRESLVQKLSKVLLDHGKSCALVDPVLQRRWEIELSPIHSWEHVHEPVLVEYLLGIDVVVLLKLLTASQKLRISGDITTSGKVVPVFSASHVLAVRIIRRIAEILEGVSSPDCRLLYDFWFAEADKASDDMDTESRGGRGRPSVMFEVDESKEEDERYSMISRGSTLTVFDEDSGKIQAGVVGGQTFSAVIELGGSFGIGSHKDRLALRIANLVELVGDHDGYGAREWVLREEETLAHVDEYWETTAAPGQLIVSSVRNEKGDEIVERINEHYLFAEKDGLSTIIRLLCGAAKIEKCENLSRSILADEELMLDDEDDRNMEVTRQEEEDMHAGGFTTGTTQLLITFVKDAGRIIMNADRLAEIGRDLEPLVYTVGGKKSKEVWIDKTASPHPQAAAVAAALRCVFASLHFGTITQRQAVVDKLLAHDGELFDTLFAMVEGDPADPMWEKYNVGTKAMIIASDVLRKAVTDVTIPQSMVRPYEIVMFYSRRLVSFLASELDAGASFNLAQLRLVSHTCAAVHVVARQLGTVDLPAEKRDVILEKLFKSMFSDDLIGNLVRLLVFFLQPTTENAAPTKKSFEGPLPEPGASTSGSAWNPTPFERYNLHILSDLQNILICCLSSSEHVKYSILLQFTKLDKVDDIIIRPSFFKNFLQLVESRSKLVRLDDRLRRDKIVRLAKERLIFTCNVTVPGVPTVFEMVISNRNIYMMRNGTRIDEIPFDHIHHMVLGRGSDRLHFNFSTSLHVGLPPLQKCFIFDNTVVCKAVHDIIQDARSAGLLKGEMPDDKAPVLMLQDVCSNVFANHLLDRDGGKQASNRAKIYTPAILVRKDESIRVVIVASDRQLLICVENPIAWSEAQDSKDFELALKALSPSLASAKVVKPEDMPFLRILEGEPAFELTQIKKISFGVTEKPSMTFDYVPVGKRKPSMHRTFKFLDDTSRENFRDTFFTVLVSSNFRPAGNKSLRGKPVATIQASAAIAATAV